MESLNTLIKKTLATNQDQSPRFFNLQSAQELSDFRSLIESKKPDVYDQFEGQLRDLIKNQNPSKKLTKEAIAKIIQEKYPSNSLQKVGQWVYYPWKNTLVHVLDRGDFIELRTVRNKYKITQEEQEILATKKIGVIGLSVGQSVSLALSMERSYGELKLADFDTLELSNYNRIRTPIQNLGLLKTTVVKREILEIDPYLKVTTFDKGLEEDKIADFIQDLDIVVDEFDSFLLKIKLRVIARKLGKPVISEMSDRGMIDIERFDLDPNRELFHGAIKDTEIANLGSLDLRKVLEKIIPFDSVSSRMQQSYMELGKTITTWPQLGADVAYGGGLCAILIRKILLEKNIHSNRYYFDIDESTKNKQ